MAQIHFKKPNSGQCGNKPCDDKNKKSHQPQKSEKPGFRREDKKKK